MPFRKIVEQHPDAAQHDQIGTLYCDGQPAIRAKAALAKKDGLGGLMIWSLDQDVLGPDTLLTTMASALGR
jgi:GH18 family chitinase